MCKVIVKKKFLLEVGLVLRRRKLYGEIFLGYVVRIGLFLEINVKVGFWVVVVLV